MSKQLIIGGLIAIAGLIALIVFSRRGSAAQALPAPAESAQLAIPVYPAAAPLPAFSVNATPYYMTFNVAPSRNLVPPPKDEHCNCESVKVITPERFQQAAENFRSARATVTATVRK